MNLRDAGTGKILWQGSDDLSRPGQEHEGFYFNGFLFKFYFDVYSSKLSSSQSSKFFKNKNTSFHPFNFSNFQNINDI